jgi:hypothetical protein
MYKAGSFFDPAFFERQVKIKSLRTLWITVVGTVVCAAEGVIFFGFRFNIQHPSLYFLLLGFSGSLILALLLEKQQRDAFYVGVFIFIVFVIASALYFRPLLVLILLIYYTAIIGGLKIYVTYFNEKLSHLPAIRPLSLAALIGFMSIIASLAHHLLFLTLEFHFLPGNLPIGFLLGFGYGIAIDVYDRIIMEKLQAKG